MPYPQRTDSPWGLCALAVLLLRLAAASAAAGPAANRAAQPRGAAELYVRIAADLAPVVQASRRVLLGGRDPRGRSCVRQITAADLRGPLSRPVVDRNGGAGTRFGSLLGTRRPRSAADYFAWQQVSLRAALVAMLREAKAVSPRVEALSNHTRRLAADIAAWKACPAGLATDAIRPSTDWPGHCLFALNQALGARDLAACRLWSAELASAAFALADLHRWEEFILANLLGCLDFQAKSEVLFTWVDATIRRTGEKYRGVEHDSFFPGSSMLLPAEDNLLEVERQAEVLFRLPARSVVDALPNSAGAPAAVWLPPEVRGTYAALRAGLSAASRQAWDRAPAEPFERSYLASMLFRISRAGMVEAAGTALARCGSSGRRADVAELMDVLFYRGGEPCSGLLWGDRFDSRLVRAAGHMTGSRAQVLARAHGVAFSFLGNWDNYQCNVWTLGEALDRRRLDCVRGTDMIGSLYRNAGRGGYSCVRLSCGLTGHSVSCVESSVGPKQAAVLADSLIHSNGSQLWPKAYFHGLPWPKGYPQRTAPAFAAERIVRGLDNYVFAEGYVIRGPHAGLLMRAAVPYLPGRHTAQAYKAYAGPYPRYAIDRPPVKAIGRRAGP